MDVTNAGGGCETEEMERCEEADGGLREMYELYEDIKEARGGIWCKLRPRERRAENILGVTRLN
jgi:hypothetical protein